MMYFFKVSSTEYANKNIVVRLQSENGHFKMYMNFDKPAKQGDFKAQGDDNTPINVNLDQFNLHKNTLHSFYVLVTPL